MEIGMLRIHFDELKKCSDDFGKIHKVLVHIERGITTYADSLKGFDQELVTILQDVLEIVLANLYSNNFEKNMDRTPSSLALCKSLLSHFLDQIYLGKRNSLVVHLKSCCAILAHGSDSSLQLSPHIVDVLLQMKQLDNVLIEKQLSSELKQFFTQFLGHPTLFQHPQDTCRAIALLSTLNQPKSAWSHYYSGLPIIVPSYNLGMWLTKQQPTWLSSVPKKLLQQRENSPDLVSYLVANGTTCDMADVLMEPSSQLRCTSTDGQTAHFEDQDEKDFAVEIEQSIANNNRESSISKVPYEIVTGFDDDEDYDEIRDVDMSSPKLYVVE